MQKINTPRCNYTNRKDSQTHTLMRTHTHTRIHTHSHAYTHTYTNTYIFTPCISTYKPLAIRESEKQNESKDSPSLERDQ